MTGAGVATVWQRFCSVSGITTELLGIHASSGSPRLQVVVFPGNPGSAAYFKPFLRALHAQLRGRAEVLAVSHAGHDPETDHGGRLWDLRQQIAHKVSFLREHVLLAGRPPVLLVGHSIGAAMMIKAVAEIEGLSVSGDRQQQQQQEEEKEETEGRNPLAAVPPDGGAAAAAARDNAASGSASGSGSGSTGGELPRIVKLVAVFPFFETNFVGSWRQRGLRTLATCYEGMGWVGAAVTSLPWGLKLACVKMNADMDSDASTLTTRLLARHVVRNAFFLAAHEFQDLSRPCEWGLLSLFGQRLHVMGCEEDTWMSRQQYDDMLGRVPGLQATWHSDLRHAFCVSERQSAAVSDTVATVAGSIPGLRLDLDLDLGCLTQPASVASVSRADSSETNSVSLEAATTSSETTEEATPTETRRPHQYLTAKL